MEKQLAPKPKKCIQDKVRKLTEAKFKQNIANYPDAYQWKRAARLGCTQNTVSKAMKQYKIMRKNSVAPKS